MSKPWQKLTRLIVDTHCHVLDYADADAVIKEITKNGLTVHAVTTTPEQFDLCVERLGDVAGIYPSLGLFPTEAAGYADKMDVFFDRLEQTRFVGEVGLDYVTKDAEDRRMQRGVFEAIVDRCDESGDKILSIHSRRAARDVIEIIGQGFKGTAILHWFSGTPEEVKIACANGFYFSVNSAMVKSERGKELIGLMDPARVLTETDGPYVEVGGEAARPVGIRAVIESLAKIWGCDVKEAARRVARNYEVGVEGVKP